MVDRIWGKLAVFAHPEIAAGILMLLTLVLIVLLTGTDGSPATRRRRQVWVGLVIVGMGLTGLLFISQQRRPSALPPIQGSSAPLVQADWQLIRLSDQQQVSLSSLKGKVILINAWATWCPPCRQEMPSLQTLYDHYKSNPDMVFLFVSLDETQQPVHSFLSQNGYTMPVYQSVMMPPPNAFNPAGIPTTWLIDREHRLQSTVVGAEDWDSPAVIEKIDSLLASKPADPKNTGSVQ